MLEDRLVEVDQLVMIVVVVLVAVVNKTRKMTIYARGNEITVEIRVLRVEVVIGLIFNFFLFLKLTIESIKIKNNFLKQKVQ